MNQQPSSTTAKIPALTKQEIAKFNSSTYEKAGLNGPPTAVSQISWSFDSKFMALRSDLSPNAVYVWDMQTVSIRCILVHLSPVKAMNWSPRTLHLTICTGQQRVFIWSPAGASVCEIPQMDQPFQISKVRWNSNGKVMFLSGANNAVLAFPDGEYLESANPAQQQMMKSFSNETGAQFIQGSPSRDIAMDSQPFSSHGRY